MSEFNDASFQNASEFDTTEFSFDTKRQIEKVGSKSLSKEEMEELSSLQQQMSAIYGSSQVCLPGRSCMYLESGLTEIMAESTNYTERLFVWEEWRRIVGRQIKPLYERNVELGNKLAVLNGFDDMGHEWRASYETENFEAIVMDLYQQLEPLYKELHSCWKVVRSVWT